MLGVEDDNQYKQHIKQDRALPTPTRVSCRRKNRAGQTTNAESIMKLRIVFHIKEGVFSQLIM